MAKGDKKLLERIRARYQVMYDADDENRRLAMEDMRFVNVPGEQWDANMKQERGDRPCMEYNKLRINGKRVINEIRANRPQGKIRAVEGGDKKIAELYEGLCRNIWNISDGDTVIDMAAEYQVDAGMGAWRVETRYSHDDTFDQDIIISPIKNPFCLYVDPGCQDPMKRDAEDWILTERISHQAFETKYGKRTEKSDFEDLGGFDDEDNWLDEHTVRIAEYWYKEPHTKEIWLVQSEQGQITVDSESDEAKAMMQMPGFEQQIVRRRECKTYKIMMCIASGSKILEGPVEWAGREFPFVMVYGEQKVVEGEQLWWGLHRFAKDAQKSYNIQRTAQDETVALSPQAKFWSTPEQAKGNLPSWAEAHRKNFPYLLYNPDAKAPGPPVPMPPPQVPAALIQGSISAAQDIRDVTGLHEASFGEESGEKSGIALARKQNQAQIVTYNFPDNMAKAIRRTWELLIDLIPNVYDAEREIRVLGVDGSEDYAQVNQVVFDYQQNRAIRVNDMTVGKYDVTVTTGPNFSTQRQEAAEVYGELATRSPELMQVAGDLIFRSLDLPYAEDIADRWQSILPPQIQQRLSEGKDMPPEVQQAMQQAQQAMQQVQQHGQLVQQAAQELESEKAENVKQKADIEKAIAQLKTEEANFRAEVAKAMADIAIKEAALSTSAGDKASQVSRDLLSSEAVQAIATIEGAAAEFVALANHLLEQMNEASEKAQSRKVPKIKAMKAKRVNGQLVAIPEYEDGDADTRVKAVRTSRVNGELVAQPEYE